VATSPNFAILCQSIEQALKGRKSGQKAMVTLPWDWKEEMGPQLISWCELMGYTVMGVMPDNGGSVIIGKL